MRFCFFAAWLLMFFPVKAPAQEGHPSSNKGGVIPRSPMAPSVPSGPGIREARRKERLRAARIKERLSSLGFAVLEEEDFDFPGFYSAGGTHPVFLTTDMFWDLYQRFLAVYFYRLELVQASRLREFSRRLFSLCLGKKGKPWLRIFYLCAPALAFQDRSALAALPEKERARVEALLAGIEEGKTVLVPGFSCRVPPEPFRPAWFYKKNTVLSGYWKALTWYRSLPLHPEEEEECETALLLSKTLLLDPEMRVFIHEMDRTFDQVLGPSMGLDPISFAEAAKRTLGEGWAKGDLSEAAKMLGKVLAGRCPGAFPRESLALGCGFRVFPGRWTPDSLQFTRDVAPLFPAFSVRLFPSGLDWVAVGPLASWEGKKLYRQEFKGISWVEKLLSVQPAPTWDSFYCGNIHALRQILEPCEGAPEIFFSPAWRAKQVWTQLGCMLPLRRNFQLHLLRGPVTGSLPPRPLPPALSPYPGFYKEVARLLKEMAVRSREETSRDRAGSRPGKEGHPKKKGAEKGEDLFPSLLEELGKAYLRLAALGARQWSGASLNPAEEAFLECFPRKWYGALDRSLPGPMKELFQGSSSFFLTGWIGPMGENRNFYQGLSKPHLLQILLPRKGKKVLHEGLVFGYREAVGPKGLSDGGVEKPALAYPRFTRLFRVDGAGRRGSPGDPGKEKRSQGDGK